MEGATASALQRAALARGMTTLRSDGNAKIRARVTTPDEVLRMTQLDMGS